MERYEQINADNGTTWESQAELDEYERRLDDQTTEFCAEHGEVFVVTGDEEISRCPHCDHATSTTMDEAVRFAAQDEDEE